MLEPIDLLIHARWVVPVVPDNTVLEDHAVAIHDGRIYAILPTSQATQRFAARDTVTLGEHVLMPGMVNLHGHSAMTLLRGIADDLPLMEWLQNAIWPLEGKFLSPEFVHDGTLLAAAEMLASGITTCNDMYFYPEAAASAYAEAGMRAVLGMCVLEFPTPYAAGADEYLEKGLAARDAWRKHPLIGFSLAPHAPYTVSDATFERITTLAAELNLPLHIHVHETQQEVQDSLKQYGKRPLHRLSELGVLSPSTIAVHAVHLDNTDLDLLVKFDCSVAHCPTSNMKLASGIAPVATLNARGVRVGLGSDGAASNNRLDLLQEMRHASLLAKVSTQNAATLPAHQAIKMATLDGARALGLDDQIGSIETGKQADLCAIELSSIYTQPCFNPISHLVFVAGREHISHVWINGKPRVHEGKLVLQSHNNELLRISAMWHHRLVGG
jgi:5-methylthioadenosine/S-adenosylhomocysteine deaminase